MRVTTDRFEESKRAIRGIPAKASARLDSVSREVAAEIFRRIKIGQPDGSKNLDPLVTEYGYTGRHARPSIRQGNLPIARGWIGPIVTPRSETSRLIEIKSKSPHVQYFTMWTGRSYLGTKAGKPQIARNTERLGFWWKGKARFPVSTRGHGFSVATDFVQQGWLGSRSFVNARTRDFARFALMMGRP